MTVGTPDDDCDYNIRPVIVECKRVGFPNYGPKYVELILYILVDTSGRRPPDIGQGETARHGVERIERDLV